MMVVVVKDEKDSLASEALAVRAEKELVEKAGSSLFGLHLWLSKRDKSQHETQTSKKRRNKRT